MPLVPASDALNVEAFNMTETAMPTYTYHWDVHTNRIRGYADGLEAMRQVIHHILFTERYQWAIYNHNYGIELADLFGKPVTFCIPKIKIRVTEALTWDNRILEVTGWRFETSYNTVMAWFTVVTVFGEVPSELEVAI